MPVLPNVSRYSFRVLNSSRIPQGQIKGIKNFVAVKRFNGVGNWGITCDASDATAQLLMQAGNNLECVRTVYNQQTGIVKSTKSVIRGPMLHYEFDLASNQIGATGADENIWLAARRAWQVPTAPDYATAVLADSPQRYFKCAESSGATATDASGHANGTWTGVSQYQMAHLVDDVWGNTCVLLNGSTGRLDATTAGLNVGTNPWTIYLWLRFPASNPGIARYPFSYGSTNLANQFAYMRMQTDGTIQAGILNATNGSSSNLPNPGRNAPHMYALRFNGTLVDWFQDGVLIASMTPTSPNLAATPALVFGGLTNDASTWPERIDECVFVNSALSDARIGFLHTLGRSRLAAKDYDVRSGAAETVIRAYVDANCVSAANDFNNQVRSVSGLTLAADGAHGLTVSDKARQDAMISKDGSGLLQRLALAGGDLGYRVAANGSGMQFQVYVPNDKSGLVKFSDDLGGVTDFQFQRTAPDWEAGGNALVVGGQGDGADRQFLMSQDTTSQGAWGRFEGFQDARDVSDIETLYQRGVGSLGQYSDTDTFAATPIQGQNTVWQVDFDLGDIVTVRANGTTYVDKVRAVEVTLDGTVEKVTPRIGAPGTEYSDTQEVILTSGKHTDLKLQARLSMLETRK